MPIVVSLAAALAFGGADQYLGSLAGHGHPWTADLSLLSAPWLLLPFLAGWTQRRPGRAALLGLACTVAALAGYMLMTLSPVESAELTRRSVAGFVRSSELILLGACFSGPLFGWAGNRWRAGRAWIGALAAAAAFCFEPLARTAMPGYGIGSPAVWIAEVAVGGALTLYVVSTVARAERRRQAAATR